MRKEAIAGTLFAFRHHTVRVGMVQASADWTAKQARGGFRFATELALFTFDDCFCFGFRQPIQHKRVTWALGKKMGWRAEGAAEQIKIFTQPTILEVISGLFLKRLIPEAAVAHFICAQKNDSHTYK